MWQALIPILSQVISKNNPQGGNALHSASQIMQLFKKM